MPDVDPIDAPIQDLLEHENPCFGCGPDNPEGLQLKSYPDEAGDGLVAEFTPNSYHAGSGGVLGGGVQATLADCHGIWTAVYHAAVNGEDPVPHYVTAEMDISYREPAPLDEPIRLVSTIAEVDLPRVHVDVEIANQDGEVCSQARVTCHDIGDGWGPNPYV
jgi:acyl-coenzyme A thioesterase PaaI-like protein